MGDRTDESIATISGLYFARDRPRNKINNRNKIENYENKL